MGRRKSFIGKIEMDNKSILLLFALISLIRARPQAGDVPNECSRFFKESAFDFSKLGFDQRTIEEKLVYNCVEKSFCNDGRDFVTPFSTGSETLLALIDTAQTATCPKEGQICCSVKYINNVVNGFNQEFDKWFLQSNTCKICYNNNYHN